MAENTERERLVTREEQLQSRQKQADIEAAAEKDDRKHDETVPGGRYMLDDGQTMVDANGAPYKEKKSED